MFKVGWWVIKEAFQKKKIGNMGWVKAKIVHRGKGIRKRFLRITDL